MFSVRTMLTQYIRILHTKFSLQVSKGGEVKLTGVCLPRKATLPFDVDTVPVSDFVYLSPEVLNQELYVSSSDVYGYGLLMYELFSDGKAFAQERSRPFCDFVANVNPIKMLRLEEQEDTDPRQPALGLIRACLNTSHMERPSMVNVLERLDGIDENIKLPPTFNDTFVQHDVQCR